MDVHKQCLSGSSVLIILVKTLDQNRIPSQSSLDTKDFLWGFVFCFLLFLVQRVPRMIEQESCKERREAEFWKQLVPRKQELKALSLPSPFPDAA